ncbi:hypothetical protein EDB87DRAFT_1602340 [Lactarius vividus]|nr:hypothetical protein EDB87DRAFT_1602319 [Lactarius vividus]KAH9063569.1 hypothetical protein EDB87DRAFT_1602340 [Lactarius vividus]
MRPQIATLKLCNCCSTEGFQIMACVGYSASASVISLNLFCIITVLFTRIPDSCLIVLIPFVAFIVLLLNHSMNADMVRN